MKNTILFFMMLFAVQAIYSQSSGDAYTKNMLIAKSMTDTATTDKTLLTAADYFIRIAQVNTDQWLPHYYAAYCYASVSHHYHDAAICDKWVDMAQAETDKAYNLAPDNPEVLVMKGYVLQARMAVDPAVRGFQYFEESMRYFSQASETDPANPRAFLWKGVNLLHTPEAYGGGKQSGCPLIKAAVLKYESITSADTILPSWGYDYAKQIAKDCQ